jgi:hypothetical protein
VIDIPKFGQLEKERKYNPASYELPKQLFMKYQKGCTTKSKAITYNEEKKDTQIDNDMKL